MSDFKLTVNICMGSACFARGNNQNLLFLEEIVKSNKLENEIDIIGSRCENICHKGSNIKVNGLEHGITNQDSMIEILKKYYPDIKY